MPSSRSRRRWTISEAEVADENVFLNRRAFLRRLGIGTATAIAPSLVLAACKTSQTARSVVTSYQGPLSTIAGGSPNSDLYPAARNPAYTLDRPLTDELVAATSNNFYEFTTMKGMVWKKTSRFQPRPWTLQVTGLVEKEATYDVDRLVRRLGIEERLYRLRCVEAWSMAVPWTGFALERLVRLCRPLSKARFVRFVSFHDPAVAPGQHDTSYPWPYYEGLSLAEATNELAFVATGIYGHELPKQHGAPLRIVVPWKYGFKSIKSIVRVELVAEQPPTFWSDVVPREYDFWSNVRPDLPHPRWSQAWETVVGSGEKRRTLPYNGYAEQVAYLYKSSRQSG